MKNLYRYLVLFRASQSLFFGNRGAGDLLYQASYKIREGKTEEALDLLIATIRDMGRV